MTKKQGRELKYAYVRNYTMDAQLARRARDWSWKRIENELGIEKVEERPRLKPIPKRVDTYLDRTRGYREFLEKENKIQEFRFTLKQSKKDRIATWVKFSKRDGKLPDEFENLAQKLNKQRGYDINDAYGFAVIHYSFTEDKSIAAVETLMTRDKFDGDLYVYNMKK